MQNFNFQSWIGEDQQVFEKSGFLEAKSLILQVFFEEVVIICLPFQNILSWNPETGLKWKKNHHLSLVLASFLTIFHIYQDFNQFSLIWSLRDIRIFSQMNLNLLKHLNFLKFFDRTEIYYIFPAIWDHPQGYSLFSLKLAFK